ncbi:MAG TPA: hypothetical protein VI455_09510 [Terriglobia bacterium]
MAAIRWVRTISALVLAAALLESANWAVRDCPTGADTFENCLWLGTRRYFGLPESKVLRAGVLEIAGLAILAGFYLVFGYLWPRGAQDSSGAKIVSAEPKV